MFSNINEKVDPTFSFEFIYRPLLLRNGPKCYTIYCEIANPRHIPVELILIPFSKLFFDKNLFNLFNFSGLYYIFFKFINFQKKINYDHSNASVLNFNIKLIFI